MALCAGQTVVGCSCQPPGECDSQQELPSFGSEEHSCDFPPNGKRQRLADSWADTVVGCRTELSQALLQAESEAQKDRKNAHFKTPWQKAEHSTDVIGMGLGTTPMSVVSRRLFT